ncbi:MAG: SMI1/KNR4 family protein [Pyrinomonadaceae bacterium]|nr:SMI1/KNR4 family protein [Pyrinomonadaceae bacterium]
MNVHEIIDKFVENINSHETNFQRTAKSDWIDEFETNLPKRLPVSFHSLISRYSFNSFDYNGLLFFANNNSDENLSIVVFKDRFISELTLQDGFIQFARPDDGSYDPICFDTNISRSRREFPIVRIDHESILCRNKVQILETVSDSFLKLALEKIKND